MCILVTYYKGTLILKQQKFLNDLQILTNKQAKAEPYPTVISDGRNKSMNKKCQSKFKGVRDVSRSFAKWTKAEDEWLLSRYKKSKSLDGLAKLHKRTPSAISLRLREFKIYI